jgi:hypothetical protein
MLPATHITAFDFILLTAVFMIAGMFLHFAVTKKEQAHATIIFSILIVPAFFGAIRGVFILGSFFIAMGTPAYTAGTPTLCQDGSFTHVQPGGDAGSECSGEGGVLKYNVSNYRKSPAYNPSPDRILAARTAAYEASIARAEAVTAQRNAAAARQRARHARYLRIRRGIHRRAARRAAEDRLLVWHLRTRRYAYTPRPPHVYIPPPPPVYAPPPPTYVAPPSGGSTCADGWSSPSTGSGTCSWHGGIR